MESKFVRGFYVRQAIKSALPTEPAEGLRNTPVSPVLPYSASQNNRNIFNFLTGISLL
jgi:hypothetical protein